MSPQWTELFADFEDHLSQWLARVGGPLPEPDPRPSESAALHLFEERLQRLQSYLDKAERDADGALAPLTTDIQALQQWLDALSAARAKLAEHTVRKL